MKPYQSSGVKEGIRLYAVLTLLAVPVILGIWISMLAGGFGEPDKNKSITEIKPTQTIIVRFDNTKILQSTNIVQPTRLVKNNRGVNGGLQRNIQITATNDEIAAGVIPTNVATDVVVPTNRPAEQVPAIGGQINNGSVGQNNNASAVIPKAPTGIIVTYAPGYEWMKACEDKKSDDNIYWSCISENDPSKKQ